MKNLKFLPPGPDCMFLVKDLRLYSVKLYKTKYGTQLILRVNFKKIKLLLHITVKKNRNSNNRSKKCKNIFKKPMISYANGRDKKLLILI